MTRPDAPISNHLFRPGFLRLGRRGVSALEFALIAPFALTLLIGTMEAGRAYWIWSTLQHAADEASRYVMVNQDAGESEVTDEALGRLPGMDPDSVTVEVDRETAGGVDFVTVRASFDFTVSAAIVPIPAVTLVGSARAALP